jgi:hypothetical protein
MHETDLDETWKEKKKKKKAGAVMTAVAEVMLETRHQWVEECQHRAEHPPPKPNHHNTQAMMQ